jgi:hypothetical protein
MEQSRAEQNGSIFVMTVIKKQNNEPHDVKLEVIFAVEAWNSRHMSQTQTVTHNCMTH